MEASHHFLLALGLDEQADERAIRRAYARRLKQIDQAADLGGFQALREAYETALAWAQYRQREETQVQQEGQLRAQPSLQLEAQSPAAAAMQSADVDATPQAAAAGLSTPAEEAPSGLTAAEQALELVWQRYQDDVTALAAARGLTNEAGWERILRARLADEELINIDARTQFEWRIVHTLGNGWRRGHEALFPAAIAVFGWADECRALAQFGYDGKLLNQAIDEHNLFFSQEIAVRSVQQRITTLLRRETQADPIEIRWSMRELESMQERFPALLLLNTNPDNVAHWREVYANYQAAPALADPALSNLALPEPSLEEGQSYWWRAVCLLYVVFLLVKMVSNATESPTPGDELARMTSHFAPLDYPQQDAAPATLSVTYCVLLNDDHSVNATTMIGPSSGDPAFDAAAAKSIRDAKAFPSSTPLLFSTTVSMVGGRTSWTVALPKGPGR